MPNFWRWSFNSKNRSMETTIEENLYQSRGDSEKYVMQFVNLTRVVIFTVVQSDACSCNFSWGSPKYCGRNVGMTNIFLLWQGLNSGEYHFFDQWLLQIKNLNDHWSVKYLNLFEVWHYIINMEIIDAALTILVKRIY